MSGVQSQEESQPLKQENLSPGQYRAGTGEAEDCSVSEPFLSVPRDPVPQHGLRHGGRQSGHLLHLLGVCQQGGRGGRGLCQVR